MNGYSVGLENSRWIIGKERERQIERACQIKSSRQIVLRELNNGYENGTDYIHNRYIVETTTTIVTRTCMRREILLKQDDINKS